jgi:hypothetical protein
MAVILEGADRGPPPFFCRPAVRTQWSFARGRDALLCWAPECARLRVDLIPSGAGVHESTASLGCRCV